MLNPFFIQGTNGEQGLIQDLINEQLQIYGIEVYYMPRTILNSGTVMKDAIYSRFKDAFPIEAYLVNYEGFDNNSIVMSKFGVRVQDEMNLIISQERFDTYIASLLRASSDGFENYTRPLEGDLIYVPLSESLMEIKYVENKKPFYQLQKQFVFDLRCELFEYEDEEITTGIPELNYELKDIGNGAELILSGLGITAVAYTDLVEKGIQYVTIRSSGYRYNQTPSIVVSSPPTGDGNKVATLTGIMTQSRGLSSGKSLDKIYIDDPGIGYSGSPPTVSFFGGGGYGISVDVGVSTNSGGIGIVTVTDTGTGYHEPPSVVFDPAPSGGITATGEAFLNSSGGVSGIRIINAGAGYTITPNITISAGSTVATGNYIVGETVSGSISGASGIVKNWDPVNFKLKVSGLGTDFSNGDIIVGAASSATYMLRITNEYELQEPYEQNDLIESEADNILDFTEINPFGEV